MDERVTGELRRSLLAAREGMRSTEWLMWLESRFVRTVANVFLAAITGAGGSVDTDELTVDLDPRRQVGFLHFGAVARWYRTSRVVDKGVG